MFCELNMALKKYIVLLLPTLGIFIFFSLYTYAAILYPGGSQANKLSVGFSWLHNYWCNLMNVKAINGALNPARPYAVTAMLFLCSSLCLFFYFFTRFCVKSKSWRITILLNGTLAMFAAGLLFTSYHNLMTSLASIFGAAAVFGILVTLYKNRWQYFMITGLVGVFLLGMNNLIYYSTIGLYYLPILQKLTFLYLLTWVIGLNFYIAKTQYP